jgi:predicted ribonuclease YlaK
MLGIDKVMRLIERNVIERRPLAYMRGRTLNDSFVILDEAQNTTVEQMKMFLTRIGFGSAAVVTGDVTQIDLPRHMKSACATRSKCCAASTASASLLHGQGRRAPSAGAAHRARLEREAGDAKRNPDDTKT